MQKFYLPISSSHLPPKSPLGFIYEHETYLSINKVVSDIYDQQIENIIHVYEIDPQRGTVYDVMVDICELIRQRYIIDLPYIEDGKYEIEALLDQHQPTWRYDYENV